MSWVCWNFLKDTALSFSSLLEIFFTFLLFILFYFNTVIWNAGTFLHVQRFSYLKFQLYSIQHQSAVKISIINVDSFTHVLCLFSLWGRCSLYLFLSVSVSFYLSLSDTLRCNILTNYIMIFITPPRIFSKSSLFWFIYITHPIF